MIRGELPKQWKHILCQQLLVLLCSFLVSLPIGYTAAQTSTQAVIGISNCWQLQTMRNNLAGHYALVVDIDCSATSGWNGGLGFEPVGTSSNEFTGVLEGRGHIITGLTIDRPSAWNVGMFGYMDSGAEVIDVHLQDVSFNGQQQVGGLVGANLGNIFGCSTSGNVSATQGAVGGLVGYHGSGVISRCHSTANVSGGIYEIYYVGGLVGENRGLLSESYASGNVSGEDDVGGLVGNNSSGIISQCYATGSVIGGNGKTGGLVGSNSYNNATILDSYATGPVYGGSGAYAAAGGLLGSNGGTGWASEAITNCYSLGSVSGDDAGGLVGKNYNDPITIHNSYWDTETSGHLTSEGGTPKTTTLMMQQSTFAGWDFGDVWSIQEGRIYPWHQWQPESETDLLHCEASGNQNFYWTGSTFDIVRECTFTVPEDGIAYIAADATLGNWDGFYEARFRIGIDDTNGDDTIDRWVSVYDTGPGGSNNSLALSAIKPLSAGTHAVYLLVQRFMGSGTVWVWDSTLSIIFDPTPEVDILSCETSGNLTWETTSTSFDVMRQCQLDLPSHGWTYISADGTADIGNSEYEAQFRLGIDSTAGIEDTDRWLNVYTDINSATDTTLTISGLLPVYAGKHTFYLLGKRFGGTGTVRVYDPTLNVLYLPATSLSVKSCNALSYQTMDISSSNFATVRQCTINMLDPGWVFISANASVNRQVTDVVAQFRIGIGESVTGDYNVDRTVDLRGDFGDGSDDTVALTMMRYLDKGTHTFYFLGKQFSGAGTIRIYDSTLTILAFKANKQFLPLVLKNAP